MRDPLRLYEMVSGLGPAGDAYLLESLDGPDEDQLAAAVGWDRVAELRIYAGRVELEAGEALAGALSAVVGAVVGAGSSADAMDAERVADAERGSGVAVAAESGAGAAGSAGASRASDGNGAQVRRWRLEEPQTVWRLLRAVQQCFEVDTDVSADSFAFGFLTTLAYEAAWSMEELPQSQTEPDQPRFTLALFRETVWFDLEAGTVRHMSAQGPYMPPRDRTDAEMAELLDMVADPGDEESGAAEAAAPAVPAAPTPHSECDSATSEEFSAWVKRCLGHIAAGDSYQIQIGHRIEVRTDLSPLDAYRRLRYRNPSPYMYLAPWAGRTVVGASPELFVRIRGGQLSMRPIAGTAVRAADPAEDARRIAGLRASVKEQAEHVMLVDLCRNDIGRVCVPRTLSVDTMMEVEPFAYVHHLVSTVSGKLRDDVDVWAAICATFPAGTMTGAPKLRAMEIINEIESTPRGVYAGALGLVDTRGFAMLALCIRTAVHHGDCYTIQASAGVVADSTPAGEWQETLAKMSAGYWALTGKELLP
ncbi:MAG TPA: anthranilate synthase component I family protein [Actinocrinis sp.]|nr:anthranilate synthase component I family protein [Actinocrinis sp.]